MQYWIVEKKNRHALHGIFESAASAARHLKETIPVYVARGYFMDKSLTPDCFEIIPAPARNKKG